MSGAETATGLEIAVIGRAGRLPGAGDLTAFWRNLRDGIESITFFSPDELLAAGADPALVADPSFVRAYGRLEGADLFDPDFFGYSPREAGLMDPQQRIFLECAWEALEDAGYDPRRCGGPVGVYGGMARSTYLLPLLTRPDLLATLGGQHAAMASGPDFLCTRVSYKLGLEGPSLTVQTACSTSLVAVHLACQALLSGECRMALAGGVAIRFPQEGGYLHQEGGILSADGHCRAFDARATGTVGGAGVGIVVLKRLESALADGDSIRAVIKGSAINNDGAAKAGYTAPRVEGQAEVIRTALAVAEVPAGSLGIIEAHGTGTRLGDPIELAALTRAFRADTAETGFCALGAVKSNIGHLDTAAGIAGLLKAVLALENRELPPSLHFTAPNPDFDLAGSPFYVNTRLRPWPAGPTPRRAGVSSFGIGGTNAHVVLEEAPPRSTAEPGRPWQLLVLSARTAPALAEATARLREHLAAHPELDLADVAYTCQVGRRELGLRRMAVCRHLADAVATLASGEDLATAAPPQEEPSVALLLPGAAAPGLREAGQDLYREEPVFRAEVDRCAGHLGSPAGAFAGEPGLFVLEYALARLWSSWGIRPRQWIGRGVGELVAACLRGDLSLEDALAGVARRATAAGADLASSVPLSREVEGTLQEPGRILLELGAGELLADLGLGQTPEHLGAPRALACLGTAGGRPPRAALLETLGRLWLAGLAVDWDAVHGSGKRRRVPLPTYPFQRRRCWLEALESSRPATPAPRPAAPSFRGTGHTASRQEVEPRLAELWRELLGVDRIRPDDDFFDLGGDSLHAIDLGARLKSVLGIELSSDFLLEAPTLKGMAELVATALARAAEGAEGAGGAGGAEGGQRPSRSSCLVELQGGNGGGRQPFFLVHPVGGHVYFYRDVAASLGGDQPVYGLRARGLEEGEEPHGAIEQMAAHYAEAVQSFQPEGPYLLGGSSMGGMVAFEMAQQLRAQGREVAVLALMDTPGPSQMPARPADPAELLFLLYGNWLPISLPELRSRGEEERVAYLLNAARSVEGFPRDFSHDLARRHLAVVAALWQTMFDYRPRPYPGSLLFFRARERGTIGFDHPEQAWIDLAEAGAEVHVVPGDHTSMHRPPHLEVLARRLRAALDRAQAPP